MDERNSGEARKASGQAEHGLRSGTAGANKGRPYRPSSVRSGLSRRHGSTAVVSSRSIIMFMIVVSDDIMYDSPFLEFM